MSELDFSRQLKSLYSQCNDLLREDGVFSNGMFYSKLEEFIRFYSETITLFRKNYESDNPMVLEKLNTLPAVEFNNYDNPMSFKTILYIVGYILFFPIGLFYLANKYMYVSATKSKLRDIAAALSTIEYLTRHEQS